MASSSSSIRKQQSLARVAALGPYAGVVDHHQSTAAELDPAVRATTPLTALERELRSRASDDSIGAVVATRPDAEYLTRKRERRRSLVSNTTTTSRARSHQAAGGPRPRRTSMESERSRNRAKLVSSSSVSSYSHSSDSPSPSQEESAGRAYLYEQLERQRAKLALGGGGGDSNSVAIDDSDDHDGRRARHRRSSAVLRPIHGNAQSSSSFKAKSEAGYYLGNSSTREKRRQSRAYPPMVRTGFDEVPHWAADAMKGVVLDNKQSSSSTSSSRSSRYHHDKSSSSRRSSTTTITVPGPYPEQEPKTPSTTTTSTKPRSRKRRGAVSARSVSGATNDDQEDDARSTHSGYSRYSTATYSHYPRGGDYNNNPYNSAAKRTSWRPSSGVDSSRARDLAAAAEQQRKLEQEQERVRELERELERVEREREQERERERDREHRRRQKQKQKEVLRVDSVEFEMCSPPPSPAGTTTVATPATVASTPKSATPRSPIYDVPGAKSRRSTASSRPVTAIYLPPSQEPAASFDVMGVYRTETVAKHELEPVDVLNKSNFLDGEVYDNSYENTAVASPETPSDHHRRSRRYSRGPVAPVAEPRPASRSSCRSLSPSRILEKGVEFKDRVHEALHDFKEDQKARAGIIPPDPNREYPSWYNTHPRGEKREHREHHHHRREEAEGRPPQQQRRRVRRNSLQQQQQPPPQFATVLTSSPEPASSSSTPPQSASASFAGRMASANTSSSPQPQQHRATPYRAEMATEAMPQQLSDNVRAPPATTRQDQERQELFCRSTRRGGRPEPFLRRPGGGVEARQQAVTENPSMALRMRAQEKINNEKRLSGLDFGFSGSNNNEGSSNISRLDSLHMPRSSNSAAATANAAVPESHRRSFFAPQWMQQQQQKQEKEQQRLPVGVVDDDNEPSLPKSAESVVSDFSFVAGRSDKLDVPPQRPLYAPSSKRDDRHGLPSQSPSPPAMGGSGGGARRLRRTNGVSISQLR